MKFTKHFTYMALICSTLTAQTGKKAQLLKPQLNQEAELSSHIKNRGCAAAIPDAQWEDQLQKLIAQQNTGKTNSKMSANYTIPVVIHIIHGGQAIGTYPNISDAQAISQINVLNSDFGGTGFNVANYPATAFTAYSTAAALPAANKDANGRPKISNFNISFCQATIDKNGAAMAVAGIDRVNYNTLTLSTGYTSKDPANIVYGDPTNAGDPTNFENFINNIVKPQTIWDPTKYMNIWVTDEFAGNSTVAGPGLLGFATFPIGVTLTGITGSGTATTDGLWCWGKSFGNTGTLDPSYNKGRTATHEIGHWMGLRHIWGDGACLTDYCLDTPPASASNGATTPSYPLKANSCTNPSGTNNTVPNGANGEMYMNFMDYTSDPDMYMFTEDQRTRAQTVMANGTYRKLLGTHGLCSTGSATAAVAAFNIATTACNGAVVAVTNNSTGNPTPSYTWSAVPATGVVFSPNANSSSPTITFANNGSYVISLAAKSSTLAVSTKTNAIVISTCTVPAVCNVTLTNVSVTDTMYVGAAGTDTFVAGCSPKAGYVYGSNCYDDLEKASFFAASKYSNVTGPYVTGAVVVFYKSGTKGTTGNAATPVNLKMYNGSLASGPTGTVGIATATANIGLITAATATNNIGYLAGNPAVSYSTAIARPYKYTFATPISATAAGFFLSVTLPTAAGDTAVLFNDFHPVSNTAWELESDNKWYDMAAIWGNSNGLSIFPIMSCTTKLTEYNSLSNNINIMPNPSTGLFNVLMTLPNAQDVSITVCNTLGQTVYSTNYKSFTDGMVSVDLSDKNQGIYFVIVSNGIEKNVQRIVITK